MDLENSYPIFQSSSGEGMVEIKDKMIFLDVSYETKTFLARFYFHLQERSFPELLALGKFFQWHPEDSGLIKLTEGFPRLKLKFPFGSRIKPNNFLLNFGKDLTRAKLKNQGILSVGAEHSCA